MHGTTKALIVAAAVLQASANPVKVFERQVPSTSANSTTSLFEPTTTASEPVSLPTDLPAFPFPDSNGTYFICSFPSSSNESTTSLVHSVTHTASLSIQTTSSYSVSVPTATDEAPAALSTSNSVLPSITSGTITAQPTASTPTPTEFTVVGPSVTAIINCIQVPAGEYPHSPPSGNATSALPFPTNI